MRTLQISWGYDPHHERLAQSIEELDAILDDATAERDEDGLHYVIDIVEPGTEQGEFDIPLGLHLGIGPTYAKVLWTGHGDNLGYEPQTPPATTKIPEFNYGGVPTEEGPETLRVSPSTARNAAREFMATGSRPTCLSWHG